MSTHSFNTPITSAGTLARVTVDENEIKVEHIMPAWAVETLLDANHDDRESGRNRRAEGYLHARVDPVTYWRWRREWERGSRSEPFKLYCLFQLQKPEYSAFRIHYPNDIVRA